MIDPKHITNQNLFDLDYASSERKHCLKKLHAAPRFVLAIEEICALTLLGTQCAWVALVQRVNKQMINAAEPGKEAE